MGRDVVQMDDAAGGGAVESDEVAAQLFRATP
jgi:hypothetical protein